MRFKLMKIDQVCQVLNWGITKFYERKNEGLFPRPVNLCGSKKGNLYFDHEIEFYITRAINLKSDDEFRALSQEIEARRTELKNEAA